MEYVPTTEWPSCVYVLGSIPARIANVTLQYYDFQIIDLHIINAYYIELERSTAFQSIIVLKN